MEDAKACLRAIVQGVKRCRLVLLMWISSLEQLRASCCESFAVFAPAVCGRIVSTTQSSYRLKDTCYHYNSIGELAHAG